MFRYHEIYDSTKDGSDGQDGWDGNDSQREPPDLSCRVTGHGGGALAISQKCCVYILLLMAGDVATGAQRVGFQLAWTGPDRSWADMYDDSGVYSPVACDNYDNIVENTELMYESETSDDRSMMQGDE